MQPWNIFPAHLQLLTDEALDAPPSFLQGVQLQACISSQVLHVLTVKRFVNGTELWVDGYSHCTSCFTDQGQGQSCAGRPAVHGCGMGTWRSGTINNAGHGRP